MNRKQANDRIKHDRNKKLNFSMCISETQSYKTQNVNNGATEFEASFSSFHCCNC